MSSSISIFRRLLGSMASRGMPGTVPGNRLACALDLETLEERSLLSATAFVPETVINPAVAPNASPDATLGSTPYTPSQVRTAYGFNNISFLTSSTNPSYYNQNAGKGETIAIVDAYNDPTITSDANAFSSTFGLPTFNSGGPVLSVVNQAGGSALPATSTGWATEIALDVEWAHAIAPQANIVLVEASNSYDNNLFAAVNYAASRAPVVSMSWGGGEFSGETTASYDGIFSSHPGVTFVAAAGDNGAAASYPAVSPNVISVGGSSLYVTSSGSWSSETAWGNGTSSATYGGSGGGYSQYEAEPAYQKLSYQSSAAPDGYRMGPDVAYDGNPNTGFYVYSTTGANGWLQVGGTSAGAPQWGALVALADQGRASAGTLGSGQVLNALYTMAGSHSSTGASLYSSYFHDITQGSNGYNAGAGYDLVTGLGSPLANNVVNYLVHNVAASSSASSMTASQTYSPAVILSAAASGPAAVEGAPQALQLSLPAPAPAQHSETQVLAGDQGLHADAKSATAPLPLGLLSQLDGSNNALLASWLQNTDTYSLALSALVSHRDRLVS